MLFKHQRHLKTPTIFLKQLISLYTLKLWKDTLCTVVV